MLMGMVALAIASVACKGEEAQPAEIDPQIDAYISGSKAKLGNLAKVKAAVDATAPLTADAFTAPPSGPFMVIAAEQLKELGECFEGAMVCEDQWWVLSRCKGWVSKSKEEIAKDGGIGDLKQCSELKYLAVARKTAWHPPSVSLETKVYEGGELSVDVMVFEIDSAKYIGGFKASAKTPETIEKISSSNSSKDVEKLLLRLVGSDLRDAVKKKFEGQ